MAKNLLEVSGDRLKSRRLEAGLSPEQLAVKVKVSASTIYRWQSGKNTEDLRKYRARIEKALRVK